METKEVDVMALFDEAYRSDDEYDNDGLLRYWAKATPDQQAVVDDFFICLCGYSFTTLLARAKGKAKGEEES